MNQAAQRWGMAVLRVILGCNTAPAIRKHKPISDSGPERIHMAISRNSKAVTCQETGLRGHGEGHNHWAPIFPGEAVNDSDPISSRVVAP